MKKLSKDAVLDCKIVSDVIDGYRMVQDRVKKLTELGYYVRQDWVGKLALHRVIFRIVAMEVISTKVETNGSAATQRMATSGAIPHCSLFPGRT